MYRYNNTVQGQGSLAIVQPIARLKSASVRQILPGDRVRIYDGLYDQFFWHSVTEAITGAHPQIKVAAYSFYIFVG
jgi:hypothetical protein